MSKYLCICSALCCAALVPCAGAQAGAAPLAPQPAPAAAVATSGPNRAGAQAERAMRQAAIIASASQGACPVGFSVRRSSGSQLRNSSRDSALPNGAQYLLTFQPHTGKEIALVRVELEGTTGPHVQPLSADVRGSGDGQAVGTDRSLDRSTGVQSLSLAPAKGDGDSFRSVVRVNRLTSVAWASLREVRYADGSFWRAAAANTCRVAPMGMMLVDQ